MKRAGPGSGIKSQSQKTFWLTTMMLPVTVWLLLIRYLPMFGIVMSFLDYRLPTRKMPFPVNLLHSPWVGLKNFSFLFTGESIGMIRNTLGYNALWIVLGLLISVTFAVLMSELTRKFLAKTYQTLMFFPYFLSWVVVAYFLFAFLDPTNGMLVRSQKAAGQTAIDWYNTSSPSAPSGRTPAIPPCCTCPPSPASTAASTRLPPWTARPSGSRWCTSRCRT